MVDILADYDAMKVDADRSFPSYIKISFCFSTCKIVFTCENHNTKIAIAGMPVTGI